MGRLRWSLRGPTNSRRYRKTNRRGAPLVFKGARQRRGVEGGCPPGSRIRRRRIRLKQFACHRHANCCAGAEKQYVAAAVELGGGLEFADQEGMGVVRAQGGDPADREAGRETATQPEIGRAHV